MAQRGSKSPDSLLISGGDLGSAEWSEQKKTADKIAVRFSVENLQAFGFKKTPFSLPYDKTHFLVIFRPGCRVNAFFLQLIFEKCPSSFRVEMFVVFFPETSSGFREKKKLSQNNRCTFSICGVCSARLARIPRRYRCSFKSCSASLLNFFLSKISPVRVTQSEGLATFFQNVLLEDGVPNISSRQDSSCQQCLQFKTPS